jgi:flagellar hook-length control protein FliK
MSLNAALTIAAKPPAPAASTSGPAESAADGTLAGFAQALRNAGDKLASTDDKRASAADRSAIDDPSPAGDVASALTDAVALAGLVVPWVAPIAPVVAAGASLLGSLAQGIAGGTTATSNPATQGSAPAAGAAADPAPVSLADFLAANAVATPSAADAPPAAATPSTVAPGVPADGGPAGATANTPSGQLAAGETPVTAATIAPPQGPRPDSTLPAAAPAADPGARTGVPGAVARDSRPGAAVEDAPVAATPQATGNEIRVRVEDGARARAEAAPALSPASVTAPTAPALREAATLAAAVDTVVASAGWHEDIAQKFAQFVSMRAGDAEIRLNPAHLGPVGIEISYSDNQASVLITAAQPATRDALEQALPHLKELLALQGIALGESSVRDQRDARGDTPAPHNPGTAALAADGIAGPAAAIEVRAADAHRSRLIDTFA